MFVLTGYWGRDYIKGKTKKRAFFHHTIVNPLQLSLNLHRIMQAYRDKSPMKI